MKHQLELTRPADDFRLAAEETEDGERIARERKQRETDRTAAEKQQTALNLPD